MIDKIGVIGYEPCSIVSGPGIREVLYIGMCTHFCPGCHNEEYQNQKGDIHDIDEVVDILTENPKTNITLSGGDPLDIQFDATLELLKRLKAKSSKNIWVYTGYTYEEIVNSEKKDVLEYIDVLVDGKFDIDKRDITLKFKGSYNQDIIDVKESLKYKHKVLYDID